MKRLFSLLVLVTLLFGCQHKTQLSSSVADPIPVQVIQAKIAESITTRTYVGTVEAVQSATLFSKYGGTLENLPHRVNQPVTTGTVLASVHSSAVNSAYEVAAATLQQAEDAYQRAKLLHEKGAMTQVQWVDINTQLNKARAAAQAAEAALEDCQIKAPFNGIISRIYTHKGMEIASGEPILELIDARDVQITISIPEQEYTLLQIGSEAWFDVPALGLTDLTASLTQKGVKASVLTHSYDGILTPNSPIDDLVPGMVVKVHFSKDAKSGILLPLSALRLDISGRYVWLVRNSKAHKTPVLVEGFQQNGILISYGISEGDQVIIAGAEKISSGMSVNAILSE
ncbi:MAG: efflux RND transporter periplasmic adaptor subunit [Bacteroidales bacterium]|nr:efflux RND transporter periplasmic adaptor subunit [Bacteroidales bacterium]